MEIEWQFGTFSTTETDFFRRTIRISPHCIHRYDATATDCSGQRRQTWTKPGRQRASVRRASGFVCVLGMPQQLGGASPPANLMEVKA